MSNLPQVSIILPTYQGERYLMESIRSCLAQTFGDFELIVVVDGSTDGTVELLRQCADPRLRVVEKENGGLPRALNSGFENARGAFWTWTSDDNRYHPTALDVMVRHLEARPECPMVVCDHWLIDEAGERVGRSRTAVACFLYRAAVARQTGAYRPELYLVEDTDFFLRLQHEGGAIQRVQTPLYDYRVHAESLSTRHIGRRQLVLARMKWDLFERGVLSGEAHTLFEDPIRQAARYGDEESLSAIIAFAAEKAGWRVAATLAVKARVLMTRPGYVENRITLAARARWRELKAALGSWSY